MPESSIAFDLDGVLIDIVTPIKRLLLELYDFDLQDNDPEYDQFNLVKATGISSKKLWEIYRMVYTEVKTTPIYPGATELLAKLYEKTNEPPLIVTARPPDSASLTYQIVKRVAKKTPFAVVLKHPRCHKSQHLSGYYYFVEDRRRTALELADLNFVIPLVRKNYNPIPNIKKYRNIFYIEGVHELIPHVDEFTNRNKYFDVSLFKKCA